MKKAMLFFVALLFTAGVNAATLNLSTHSNTNAGVIMGNNTSTVFASGVLVEDTQNNQNFKYWALFNLVADVDTGIKLAAQLIPLINGSVDIFRVRNNGSLLENIPMNTSLAGTSGVGSFMALAGETYRIVLRSSDEKVYNITASAVPVPAALLLFAPALLGFLGLRRKALLSA